MTEQNESWLNQKRHFSCHKFPCIFYRTVKLLSESPQLYLAVCPQGVPECYPAVLEAVRGNRFLFSCLSPEGMLTDGLPAEICVRNGDWIVHVRGVVSDCSSDNCRFLLKDLSGKLHHIPTGIDQTLILD